MPSAVRTCALIVAASAGLAAGALDPVAAVELRIGRGAEGFDFQVEPLPGPGAVFVYGGSDPGSLMASPVVVLQMNAPMADSMRFTIPTVRIPGDRRFYSAAFWPNFNPGTNLVYVPAGHFTMGSPELEPARWETEGPETEVTISRGFWMGRFEVTQGEFEAVMGRNPSEFTRNPSLPVEQVDWSEAVAFCQAMTTRERVASRLPSGYTIRLPTEAEWEYACRAGSKTAFHFGDELRSGMANFNAAFEYPPCDGNRDFCPNPNGEFRQGTVVVGTYPANAWGLHDMHGNVSEWCADWWAGNLPGGNVVDPVGPSPTAPRVIRGGGWRSYGVDCRSASRSDSNPIHGNSDVGFRVVVGPIL